MSHAASFYAAAPLDGRPGALAAAGREIALSYAFIRRDLPAAVYPALLFAAAARRHVEGASAIQHALAIAACGVYFWLFLYQFCLANQITGVEEDRLNKPDRPIPSGAVTLAGARRRLVAAIALFLVAGLALGVLPQTCAWIALSALNHRAGWDRSWFLKNVGVIGAGAVAQLSAAHSIAAPGEAAPWRWILVLAATLGGAMVIQDFRDVEGDRRLHRRTLPIVLGDLPARLACAAWMLALPVILHVALLADRPRSIATMAFDAAVGAMSIVIAARLLARRDPRSDDATYRLVTALYCVEIAAAAALV
jgi:4-hydroxybenzoate polyprenyltransferase